MNYICVFDLETDSLNPDTGNIVQIACTMIDPYTLDIVDGSEFYSQMRPRNIDDENYLTSEVESTIAFHLKLRNITKEELLEEWRNSPPADVIWNEYVSHVNKYNRTGKVWDAPYPGGINIINFDLKFTANYQKYYKTPKLYGHEIHDIRHYALAWLGWDTSLRSRSMDSLRDYFGLPKENAHNALIDVRHEAPVLQKFLKLHKKLFPNIKFRNCFVENTVGAIA